MSASIELWPATASEHAEKVDLLIASFGTMVWLLTLPVFVLMARFAIRYRRSRNVNRKHGADHNLWVELSWSIIPFLLTLGFYVWATLLFLDLYRPPAGAMAINVVAKQWMWKFQHEEGAREINSLHVPVDTAIKLVMTSQDVIHSLYLPAMRIKQDILPNRYTTMWFKANKAGEYPLRCAEFCGTDHSVMGGRLIVMRRADYARWLAANRDGGMDRTMAARGKALFGDLGCSGCHAPRAAVQAPPLDGISGRTVGLADGSTVIADDQYIRDAIMLPNKQVVAGYRAIMPTYGNLLAPDQVNELVAYLKSTRAGADGEMP